jgi:phosphopantothenoylcysteine decarboxylase/phosphopantothenate--cysteine ligase
MKFLITAGPTREPIDPVRFISNRSSGKMGYALASAAYRKGHKVRLISGPVALTPSAGIKAFYVQRACEMLEVVKKNLEWCDVLIMAAAVADFAPAHQYAHKLKKSNFANVLTVKLKRTPDILKTINKKTHTQFFVGFAAETRNVKREALKKLLNKNLDLIVANDVSKKDRGFEADTNAAVVMGKNGYLKQLPLMSKQALAKKIITIIEKLASSTFFMN